MVRILSALKLFAAACCLIMPAAALRAQLPAAMAAELENAVRAEMAATGTPGAAIAIIGSKS